MSADIIRGQIWRRKRNGLLVTVVRVINVGSERKPYCDITWCTTTKPKRRGSCFEDYWLRDYELVAPGPDLATADDVIAGRARYADTPGGHADRHTLAEEAS